MSIWCHGRPSLASASNVTAHALLSNHENSLHSGNDGAGGCQTVRSLYGTTDKFLPK